MTLENIEKIYNKIRKDILTDQYRQGEPLPEQKLSAKYAISRSRVRQILRKLETAALVEKIPGKGAFVKIITTDDLKKIYEMREALEVKATQLAARKRTAKNLDKILVSFKQSGLDNLRNQRQVGQELHHFILESCQNELIINAMEHVKIQMMKVLPEVSYDPADANESYLEHQQILKAIVDQNDDLAEKFMKDHLKNAFKKYLTSMFSQYLAD